MITLMPGTYQVTEAISMADLRGEAVMFPADGTLNEQLSRRSEALPDGGSRNAGAKDDLTTSTD